MRRRGRETRAERAAAGSIGHGSEIRPTPPHTAHRIGYP
jgi:hypothetical protein